MEQEPYKKPATHVWIIGVSGLTGNYAPVLEKRLVAIRMQIQIFNTYQQCLSECELKNGKTK